MLFGLPTIYLYAFMGLAFAVLFIWFLIKLLRPETRVLQLNDVDGRLNEIKIDRETARSLKHKNRYKWFKYGRSYLSVKHGKRVTTFLGKMGTAYTWKTNELGEKEKFATFWDALNVLWEPELIKKIPALDADKLKTSNMYVTLNLQDGFTPTEFEPVTEDMLQNEEDTEMAIQYAEGAKGARKTALLPLLTAAGTGGLLVMIVLGFLGWLRVGGATAPPVSSAIYYALVSMI